jgi:cytochrome c oxidase subunit 3
VNPAAEFPVPPPLALEVRPDCRKVGMICFFASEVAFFSTLIMAYLIYLGKSTTGPTPAEALSLPLVIGTTICLLSSSLTVHLAEKMLHAGHKLGFMLLWSLTILLGTAFLLGTAYEWYGLIVDHGLTISRNLFGTTYYTLVGFHAAHVTVGVLLLVLMLGLFQRGAIMGRNPIGIQLVSWYWHFVDGVWVVVFTLVYLIGR